MQYQGGCGSGYDGYGLVGGTIHYTPESVSNDYLNNVITMRQAGKMLNALLNKNLRRTPKENRVGYKIRAINSLVTKGSLDQDIGVYMLGKINAGIKLRKKCIAKGKPRPNRKAPIIPVVPPGMKLVVDEEFIPRFATETAGEGMRRKKRSMQY